MQLLPSMGSVLNCNTVTAEKLASKQMNYAPGQITLNYCGDNTFTGSRWSTIATKRIGEMFRDYVNEIDVLSQKHVHIKDKQIVNKILHNLIHGGSQKLQAVFDFDRTITKQHENGKSYLSSFGKCNNYFFFYYNNLIKFGAGLFPLCKSITQDFIDREESLRNKYFPLEFSPSIPFDEKRKLMEEWWSLSELMLKYKKVSFTLIYFINRVKHYRGLKVSREEIDEVVTKYGPSLR